MLGPLCDRILSNMTKRFADQPDYSGEGEAITLEAETSQLIFSLLVSAGVNSDNIHRSNIPIARALTPNSTRRTSSVVHERLTSSEFNTEKRG